MPRGALISEMDEALGWSASLVLSLAMDGRQAALTVRRKVST